MKRAFVDQKSHAADEKLRAKLKHQTLLQEYLQLQKEYVSTKRKLRTRKQKRDTLVAEVRFLRLRHRYLFKVRPLKFKDDQLQNSDAPRKMLKDKRKYSNIEAPLGSSPYSGLVANLNERVGEEGLEEREQIGREPLRMENKSQDPSSEGRRLCKKKISWQDKMPLNI